MRLHYTICFIKQGDSVLLLNREYPSWMGMWNGVGGKIEMNETPLTCILREIEEETGLKLKHATYKGKVTWESTNKNNVGGMYAFVAEIPKSYIYETPIKRVEGILDWKKMDWILHPKNKGVANLRYFLPLLLSDDQLYRHRFVYNGEDVVDFQSVAIEQTIYSK